jgi:hypothetical protein
MKLAVVVVLVGVVVTLTLGAAANSFEGSVARAGREVVEAPPVAKPEEVKFEGGPLPATVDALFYDEVNGTVAVVVSIENPHADVAATGITIGIELLDAAGKVVGTNTAAGTDPALNKIASIGPGETALYVNDTIIPDAAPASATVKATGTPERVALTDFDIVRAELDDSPFGVSIIGTIRNPGATTETQVHPQAVIRRGGEIVGAGGALVDSLPAGGEAEFQIFVIGEADGEVEVWAPAQ